MLIFILFAVFIFINRSAIFFSFFFFKYLFYLHSIIIVALKTSIARGNQITIYIYTELASFIQNQRLETKSTTIYFLSPNSQFYTLFFCFFFLFSQIEKRPANNTLWSRSESNRSLTLYNFFGESKLRQTYTFNTFHSCEKPTPKKTQFPSAQTY